MMQRMNGNGDGQTLLETTTLNGKDVNGELRMNVTAANTDDEFIVKSQPIRKTTSFLIMAARI